MTPSELQHQRELWWSTHFKKGMTTAEVFLLNQQVMERFPMTREEMDQRWKEKEGIPEFVL